MIPHVTMPTPQISMPTLNPNLSNAAWSSLFIPMMNAIRAALQTTILVI